MAKYRSAQPSRRKHPRILILCEGKTERVYFKSLKRELRHSGLHIPLTTANTARDLVEEAVRLYSLAKSQDSPYSSMHVVVDDNLYPLNAEAFDLAHTNGIVITFSNPCFELWYLLHFIKYSTASFNNCESVVRQLQKHLPAYKKGKDYSAILTPLRDTAIQNAKSICTYWDQVGNGKVYRYNPYCDVCHLVERIQQL